MSKSFVIICFWVMVLLLSGAQGWSSEDMDSHFIDADLDSSKTIFIDVKDVSLLNVLKIISKQSNLSFVAAQDVADKKITLYLNKVPLNQALATVLDANNLTYEMQNDTNIFVIKAKYQTATTKITRVYPLKYATVSSSKLNSTISIGSGGNGKGGLEEAVQDALSKDGKVIEDTRTNSLIITDVPGQFNIIENTIAKLDVPIPEILIEVEMLNVSKSVGDQLGITYGPGGAAATFTPLSFTGGTKSTNFPFGPSSSSNSSSSTGSDSSSTSGSSSTTGSTTGSGSTSTTGWNANGLQATLNFLATSSDGRTLARPRILTLNNETAQIQISTDQALSVENTSTSTSASGSTVTGNTVERYTTGVILKVTPQANLLTREITLAISPKVIDVNQSDLGSTIYDPETSGIDSILRLKDGQTMVIGGLMNEQTTKSSIRIPVLGDLPLIGALFRETNKTKSDRELIIFLTPHIIDDANSSALKGNSPSNSAQAALDIQDAENRAQEISNTLNNFDTK